MKYGKANAYINEQIDEVEMLISELQKALTVAVDYASKSEIKKKLVKAILKKKKLLSELQTIYEL